MENLSDREVEILKRIIAGSTNPVIAKNLFISLATVKAHVSSIFRKLNATNRVEAAVKGVDILKNLENKDK